MGVFLGFDSSTQSLSAMVIDTAKGSVVLDESVNFGKALPHYESPQGFLSHEDPRVKHANPLMWAEALDRLCEQLRGAGFDFGEVEGISGAGQQHGSVYLRSGIHGGPAAGQSLRDYLEPILSRSTAPIWMDASTTSECREIADAAGGDREVVRISGSRVIERFTGPQIRKFYKEQPQAYADTAEIHLVSSLLASLLVGSSVGVDYGDGAGMNLLDLERGVFSPKLLEATAPGLAQKLLRPLPSSTRVGTIARYFVEKYGFRPGTPVIAFTGDNPSSLVGMGATEPGTAVISLGTSDTIFAAMRVPHTDPRGFGHVFGNPAAGFMSLICFANGSLARERVKDQFGLSWEEFDAAIRERTQPGNGGDAMLPFFVPEMTPKRPQGVRLYGGNDFIAWRDPNTAVRAIVEAQALNMRLHSDWIGQRPKTLLVTGGASRNRGILQIVADVFQAELCTLKVGNSSALGAALRAAQAVEGKSFAELTAAFAAPSPDLHVAADAGARAVYDELGARFVERLAEPA